MALKSEMSKSYDRLEWSFIESVLSTIGFDEKFITWIMQCITTVRYSFSINDSVPGRVTP